MNCPNCGTQLPEGAPFCQTCGAQLAAPGYAPVDAGGVQPAPKKKNLPLIIGIAAAAIAVIVLLVVLLGGGNSPEGVVEDFYDALLSGDLDEALEYVHPDMVGEIDGEADEIIAALAMFEDSIEIDVLGSELISDDYEIEDVQDLLDEYDIDEDLGDVYEVEVEIAINFMGMNQTQTSDVIVAEIGGTYYIVDAG